MKTHTRRATATQIVVAYKNKGGYLTSSIAKYAPYMQEGEMEPLIAIYLYSIVSGALIAIYFGLYLFVLNLVIVFALCMSFCSMSSYGFLNSVLFAFSVIASNQLSFMSAAAYKYLVKAKSSRVSTKHTTARSANEN